MRLILSSRPRTAPRSCIQDGRTKHIGPNENRNQNTERISLIETLLNTHHGIMMVLVGSRTESMFDHFHHYFPGVNRNFPWLLNRIDSSRLITTSPNNPWLHQRILHLYPGPRHDVVALCLLSFGNKEHLPGAQSKARSVSFNAAGPICLYGRYRAHCDLTPRLSAKWCAIAITVTRRSSS